MQNESDQKLTKLKTLFIAVSAFSLFLPALATADNIGGKIVNKKACLCSLSTYIKVEGPAEGEFMKVPFFSKVYDHKKLEKDKNVLGLSNGITMKCKTINAEAIIKTLFGKPECDEVGSGKIISKIGTSK